MAEAVFKHIVNTDQLQQHFPRIDSAGTASYHVGDRPDSRSAQCCKSHGVPVDHRARQLHPKDFEEFDWILCMDDSNYDNIMNLYARQRGNKNGKAKVKLLGEFDPEGERVIEDPYYGGPEGFEHNFRQCERACRGFIKSLGL